MLDKSLPIAVPTVEADDSGTMRGSDEDGGRGVVSSAREADLDGSSAGAWISNGDSGCNRRFSLIELTIFSRSTGVMCLSFGLLRQSAGLRV